MVTDERKIIYNQDCEFCRYQDSLTWGRFKTAAIIEGGMLYGLFIAQLDLLDRVIFGVLASLLVFVVSLLSLKDHTDALGHLHRISEFEKDIAPWRPVAWWGPAGGTLLVIAVVIVNVANAIFILRFVFAYFRS